MSHHINFDVDCPNNHNQSVKFSPEEFEQALKAGLVMHCNTCDANWPLSHQDIAKIRKEFAKS